MKAKNRQCDQLKEEVKEIKKKSSPYGRAVEAVKIGSPAASHKDVFQDMASRNDQISSKDENTKPRAESPSYFKQAELNKANNKDSKYRNSSLQQVQESNDAPTETLGGKLKTFSRKNTGRDTEMFKVKSPTNKKSLFRALIDEQEGRQTVVSVSDSSLCSLIFADVETPDEQGAGRYDRMIEKLALKNSYLAIVNNLLTNKRNFMKLLMGMTESSANEMFSTLRSLYVEIIELLKGAQRIRGIFDAAPMISTSMGIEEAIQAVVSYVCDSLKCERATVFALDKVNNQLWSKLAVGNKDTIKVTVGQGIAGYVALTANSLNIRDAYFDERFDKTNDERTGFKTKTILAVPIVNMAGEVEGVIQAINKKPDEEGNLQYFERNDLGLLEMVASIASLNIKNTIEFNQQLGTLANMRNILRLGVKLYPIKEEIDICREGAKILSQLFNSSQARLFLVHPKKAERLYTFDETGKKKKFGFIGIIGEALETRQVTAVSDSEQDPRFNGLIDIKTTFTLLSVPLVEHATNTLYGAFQAVYSRSADGFFTITKHVLNKQDFEVIDFVAMQLTHKIKSLRDNLETE